MANETATAKGVLDRFKDQRTVLLTTYRRDGRPVGTPVNIAVDGDHAFVRTWDTSWKFKRIRNNPEVEIAPSTVRGKVTGPPIRARARVLAGNEAAHAAQVIVHKYPILHGVFVPLNHLLLNRKTIYFELTQVV